MEQCWPLPGQWIADWRRRHDVPSRIRFVPSVCSPFVIVPHSIYICRSSYSIPWHIPFSHPAPQEKKNEKKQAKRIRKKKKTEISYVGTSIFYNSRRTKVFFCSNCGKEWKVDKTWSKGVAFSLLYSFIFVAFASFARAVEMPGKVLPGVSECAPDWTRDSESQAKEKDEMKGGWWGETKWDSLCVWGGKRWEKDSK